MKHVSSENEKVDLLTKALFAVRFERLRNLLGMKALGKHVRNYGGECWW